MSSMLCFLIASIVGIIEGLYIEITLCIALYCFLILTCVILKVNSTKIFFLICCSFIFYIYTNFEINKYDTKYVDGKIEGNFKIISYKDEKDYYDKYTVKSSRGDKFYIFLPKGDEIKKGTIIHSVRKFCIA